MNKKHDFTLIGKKEQSGKLKITAIVDGDPIYIDVLDPANAKQRLPFIEELAKLGCDPDDVKNELLSIADETEQLRHAPSSNHDLKEIDISDIHRPERFIGDGFNALSVPIFLAGMDGLISEWQIYLNSNGNRSQIELTPTIVIENKTIYFQTIPPAPNQNNKTGWEQQSRQDWLAGKTQVNPAELFERIRNAVNHFVEFEPDRREGIVAAISCWILLTYGYTVWDAVPYLFFNGPTGSGKSTVFDVLQKLCFRVLKTDMPSAASIYRSLNETGGTLLYDEAERLKVQNSDDIGKTNAMLLAGYRRGGCADLIEKSGDNYRRQTFSVYGPKAIANINGLPPALQSRCIEVTMQRAPIGSQKPNRQVSEYDWTSIENDLHIIALDHGNDWQTLSRENMPVDGLNGRDNELWKPLVSLAHWLESHGVGGLTELLVNTANQLSNESKELQTDEVDFGLLKILADSTLTGELLTPKSLCEKAKKDDWDTYKSWTPQRVAGRLKAYGLRTSKSGGNRFYRDSATILIDIQRRYGIDFGLPDEKNTVDDAQTAVSSVQTSLATFNNGNIN